MVIDNNIENVPSGKESDGSADDWNPDAEELGTTAITNESFLCTWDNSNVYFAWKGRNLETDGVLMIAIDTGTGGSNSSWNYATGGIHNFSTDFNGCDFILFYDNNSSYGLLDGNNNYTPLIFDGNMTAGSDAVEIRVPRSNIGFAKTIKIIPFIQTENSGEIVSAMPRDDIAEHLRNPIGLPTQTFISWYVSHIDTTGLTPKEASVTSGAPPLTPTWTFNLGDENRADAIAVGYNVIYVSIGGLNPGLASFRQSDGQLNWRFDLPGVPTSVTSYYESASRKDILGFCVGNTFYAAYDNLTSMSIIGTYTLSGTGAPPIRSTPPDGNGYAVVYAYIPLSDGTMIKINIKTLTPVWQTPDIFLSERSNVITGGTFLYVAGTDGTVRSLDINGNITGQTNISSSPINNRISFSSALTSLYAAPDGNTLFSLRSNLSSKWTYSTPDNILAAPYVWPGTSPGYIFCPSGKNMIRLTDSAETAVYKWTYQTTGNIIVNPVALGSAVYFSSSDKRNFAIHKDAGVDMPGWPSAVFNGSSNSRVVVDGTTNSVFYGASSKIYRYPKQ